MKKDLLLLIGLFILILPGSGYAQPRIYFDFDVVKVDKFSYYQGATWEGIVENPSKSGINESDSVGLTTTGNVKFAGIVYFEERTIDLTDSQIFTLDVYSDSTGYVKLKLEHPEDKNVSIVKETEYTTPGQWEKLSFDFTDGLNYTYAKLTFIIDSRDADAGEEWYLDNLKGPELSPEVVVTANALFTVAVTNSEATDFKIEIDSDGTKLALYDDGTNGDETASDGIWSVSVPEITAGNHVYDVFVDDALISEGNNIAFTIEESEEVIAIATFDYDGTVVVEQTPFGENPMIIPGKIEAEDFDKGGEDVAFSVQVNANVSYTDYRPEASIVGMEHQGDGAVTIGFVGAGEWLKYTVDVSAGTYDVKIRYATGVPNIADERGIKVFLDDVEILDFDTAAVGGDWANYLDHTIKNVNMPASAGGVLKVQWKTGGFNLDYLEFTESLNTAATGLLKSELQVSSYPNPFKNVVNFDFDLQEKSNVSLSVFDISGQKIFILNKVNMEVGKQQLVWNGTNHNGSTVTDGIYFVKLNINDKIVTRKIIKK